MRVKALLAGLALATALGAGSAHAQDGIAPGIYEAYVVGIQQALAEHGFKPGKADGVLGGQTKSAIRAYQRKAGLPVDGKPSQTLLDHIKFTQPPIYASSGGGGGAAASSPRVAEIQTLLEERGYKPGPVDGVDGARTRDAARAYQRDVGLPVTGQLDQALLDSLKAARQGAAPLAQPPAAPAAAPPTTPQ